MTRILPAIGMAALTLAGCATGSGGAGSALQADVRDANGRALATARAVQQRDGLRVTVAAAGLAPGTYAVHVHAVGRCEAPVYTSAGAHWNPGGRQHGFDNPQGAHHGDLPNLVVGQTGQGSIEYVIRGARAAGGADALMDTDGAALVVHQNPDDYRTDPAGNAGSRIACGVFG